MVVPDFELICEIMLVAEGFLDARLLARKFITLYSLCKELLSKQVACCLLLLMFVLFVTCCWCLFCLLIVVGVCFVCYFCLFFPIFFN